MITRRPAFYNRFQCIGSACSDNCCIGWEIDIDKHTNEVYQLLEGTFGERLRSSVITNDNDTHFVMEKERCPFLNDDNLCDIIITLGEDKICEICREHPRFYEWFGELTEAGLGLCCEEAARLLFENNQPIVFEVINHKDNGSRQLAEQVELLTEKEETYLAVLLDARDDINSILQDRNDSIWVRLSSVLDIAVQMQECIDFDDPDGITVLLSECEKPVHKISEMRNLNAANFYREMLSLYRSLEPIDNQWPKMIDNLDNHLDTLLKSEPAFLEAIEDRLYEYEHLSVYLMYRYFLKAVFDGELLSRVKSVVLNVLIVKLLDLECWTRTGTYSKEDRIQTVKSYSKEIEYCVENLEEVMDATWDKKVFSTEILKELLQD